MVRDGAFQAVRAATTEVPILILAAKIVPEPPSVMKYIIGHFVLCVARVIETSGVGPVGIFFALQIMSRSEPLIGS